MKTCLKLGISILLLSVTFSGLTQVLTRYAKHEIIGDNGNFGVPDSGPLLKLSPPESASSAEMITKEANNSLIRFGQVVNAEYNLGNAGEWYQTNQGRVWKLNIQASGVQSLNFIFSELSLAENGVLYLYNSERTMLYGPIINRNRGNSPQFITDPIKGETITLELFEPQDAYGSSRLSIAKIILGRHNIFDDSDQFFKVEQVDDLARRSGIVPNGDLSNSKATIILEDGASLGSGILLNNTCEDFTPYILTSSPNHAQVENWAFRFPYRRSTNETGSTTESWISFHGATFRAGSQTDGIALVEMTSRPNAGTGVHYAGWKVDKSTGSFRNTLTALLDPGGSETATSHTIPITTISGPVVLCEEAPYELIHLTDDAQVTGWTVSNPEAVAVTFSNNTYTLKRLNGYNGSITFRVHLATNCGNISIERRVWVGSPVIDHVNLPGNWVLTEQQIPLSISTVRGSRSAGIYKAEIQQMGGEYQESLQGSTLKLDLPSVGIYKVDLFARNACGFSSQPYSLVMIGKKTDSDHLFSIEQKAAVRKLNIGIKGDELLDSTFDHSLLPVYRAVLYNSDHESVLASNSYLGKIVFDTAHLAKGIYKLTVYYGDTGAENHEIRIGSED